MLKKLLLTLLVGAIFAISGTANAYTLKTYQPTALTTTVSGSVDPITYWAMDLSPTQTINSVGTVSTTSTLSVSVLTKTAADSTETLIWELPVDQVVESNRVALGRIILHYQVQGAALDAAATYSVKVYKYVNRQLTVNSYTLPNSSSCIDVNDAAITTAVGTYTCTITLTNTYSMGSEERAVLETTFNGGASTVVRVNGLTVASN